MPDPRCLPAAVRALPLALALAAAGAGAQTQADFDLPGPPATTGARHTLWATHYFVHAAPALPAGVPFKGRHGAVLSDPVRPRDWCLAAIEGTVQASHQGQPRTLNYGGTGPATQVDCAAVLRIDPAKKPWIRATGRSYFVPAGGPFGDGVAGFKLVPLRSVAVDKAVIPYGTVLFLPAVRGLAVALPAGGSVQHDGYFFAADTGGAIKGNHIDVFCGATALNCLPDVIGSDPGRTFEAVVVKDAAVAEALRARHR